jgi:hypothetical protein
MVHLVEQSKPDTIKKLTKKFSLFLKPKARSIKTSGFLHSSQKRFPNLNVLLFKSNLRFCGDFLIYNGLF